MADLSDNAAAQTVKITGADSSGIESSYIESASSSPSLTATALITRPLPYEPKTYSASASGFVSAASATDVFTITGSASKTIRIHHINVSGTTTSGSAIKVNIQLIKRSTVDSGGTPVSVSAVPYDSTNNAATATIKYYTANPTSLGTTVGIVRATQTSFQQSGLTNSSITNGWDFQDNGQQPLILRGTSEQLAVNFNATTITGSVISIWVEWSEV